MTKIPRLFKLTVLLIAALLLLAATAYSQEQAVLLSLEDAINMALTKNQDILKADQDIIKAKSAVTEYKSDAYPQLQFNAEWKHNLLIPTQEVDMGGAFNPILIGLGIPPIQPSEIDIAPPDEFTFNVGLTQNIYTFGRLYNAIKLAKVYEGIAQTGHEVIEADVKLEVSEAYFQVLFAKELVEVAGKALEQSEQTRDNLKAKFEQGLISEFDYLRSEVEASNRKPPYISAQNGVTLSEKNLKRLIGLDLSTPIVTTSQFSETPVELDLYEARTEALNNRQELTLFNLKSESAKRTYGIYRSDMLPSISGFSDYTWAGSEQTGFGGSGDLEWINFWTAGLRLYVPIFDGLRNYGRMKQAKATQMQAELDKLKLEDAIRLEVENKLITLGSIQAEFIAVRKAVEFAQRTVELAKLRFDNGLGTQLDVLDAETALILARQNQAEARYRYNVGNAQLYRALGRY